MAYASANDRVVLTHDLDFSANIAATHGEKPSLVQIRAEDVSPDVIGLLVITGLRQMPFRVMSAVKRWPPRPWSSCCASWINTRN